MNIGEALKYYRKLSRQTQSQIAEIADVNEKYYGELERNESSPTVDKLEKICLALGVSISQVVEYKPLNIIKNKVKIADKKSDADELEFYCNCCGTAFFTNAETAVCPCCCCEFSEENDYIEKYD